MAATITRAEVLRRSLEGWPKNAVPYDQGELWSDAGGTDDDGWRQDCSGYVSMCLGLARSGPGSWGGYSTETLATHDLIFQLGSVAELEPGDLIGRCGPGTAGGGGGHIALYIGPSKPAKTTKRFLVRDHGGSGDALGYDERTVNLGTYRAWRYAGVEGAIVPALGFREMRVDDYGLDVLDLQRRLNKAGASPKLKEDKAFGPVTFGAVKAFQKRQGLLQDGVVGRNTTAKLLAVTAAAQPPAPAQDELAVVRAELAQVKAALVTAQSERDRLAAQRTAALAALGA